MKENFKYQIPRLIEEIEDKETKENVQGSILWKLRISYRTFYRRAYAKVGQEGPSYTFEHNDLEVIAGVFNTRTKCVPILIPDDLISITPSHV